MRRLLNSLAAAALLLSNHVLNPAAFCAQVIGPSIPVNVRSTMDSLLVDEDTDHDRRITIEDAHITGTGHGDKRFWLHSTDGRKFEVTGTYYLSNLLQELTLAQESRQETAQLDPARIFEPPVDRISRMIRDSYWNGLTRTIDTSGLVKILSDEKTKSVDGRNYVYVPADDSMAREYFTAFSLLRPDLRVSVVQLPQRITGEFVRSLDGRHGILTLALRRSAGGGLTGVPFVVPGGRFNEMYGWDSYFITLGLLQDGKIGLARDMVDNFVYEITHYGKILNANRTYYLTRSQPPFLTSMIRAVFARLPAGAESRQWLAQALDAAIREYTDVWMSSDHVTPTGLSRYFDTGSGQPPEVEPGHFDVIYARYAARFGMDLETFRDQYAAGKIRVPELDTFFVHDRAMRESGHDTSYRLIGICADLVTVDLNSLLYAIERDIGDMIRTDFHDRFRDRRGKLQTSASWYARASHRKDLMNRYCWNADRGMFFDYDVVRHVQQQYVSATALYPLWAGLASRAQAVSIVRSALPLLEEPGGVVASTEESRGALSESRPPRQWDYPFGWAPHQMLAWRGLQRYGYDSLACRLAYRWLYTITSNAVDYNGTVPEKFDVVIRSHQVFAEYGNVGTTFSYITREGFGWTNASYVVGLALLPARDRTLLNRLVAPEWIF